MKKTPDSKELILEVLKEKSSLKQDVYQNTLKQFDVFKQKAKLLAETIHKDVSEIDKRVEVSYKEISRYEFQLQVAADVLVFSMHTNVFQFDQSQNVWKTSYLKENPLRSFCGIIYIYNFLADSLRFNRMNDMGYLIARVIVNSENHFLVQGKRQLAFLYNDFIDNQLNEEKIAEIIKSAILYSLDFDLLIPPYDQQKEVSVGEMKEMSESNFVRTAKRMGFKFEADSSD
jgi:hypothetical protein